MLAADKLQLQSSLKQQATALKEKEFNLHHSNLMTVGTQAAVLAGLDITMFIEFQPPHDETWEELHHVSRAIKFVYYVTIVSAFCANIYVVAQSTSLSVMGSSLALRGPDGSMIHATDGLYEERKYVFASFALGLIATVSSVLACVWLILSPEAALVCMAITAFTGMRMHGAYKRVANKFGFDENDTVDFTDIFEGPAAIRTVITNGYGYGRKQLPSKEPRRQQDDGKGSEGRRMGSKAGGTVTLSDTVTSHEYDETEQLIVAPSSKGTWRRRNPRAGGGEERSDYDVEAANKSRGSKLMNV